MIRNHRFHFAFIFYLKNHSHGPSGVRRRYLFMTFCRSLASLRFNLPPALLCLFGLRATCSPVFANSKQTEVTMKFAIFASLLSGAAAFAPASQGGT